VSASRGLVRENEKGITEVGARFRGGGEAGRGMVVRVAGHARLRKSQSDAQGGALG